MKSTLSKNKDQIILENGEVHIIQNGETVADFMARIKKLVQSAHGEKLTIKKAVDESSSSADEQEAPTEELSELEKFRRQLLAKAEANKPKAIKEVLPEMTEEQRAAFEANQLSLKAIREQQKEEARKKKEEERARKEAEKAAAAEKLRKEKEAKLAEERAARQPEVDLMIEEANKVAEQMMVDGQEALQLKVQTFLNEMTEKAQIYLETGKLPSSGGRRRSSSTTSSGESIDPNPEEVAHIRSLIGAPVTFERNGETLNGEVQGVGIDRRRGLAMFKIKVDGKTYYSSYNKIDELTFGEIAE